MTTVALAPRVLTPAESEVIARARIAREAADQAAQQAVADTAAAVVALHDNGWTMREIGRALGLSHQRIHQIISAPPG